MSLPSSRRRPCSRAAVAVVVAVTAALPACSDNPQQPDSRTEAGPDDLAEAYDGPYTEDFHTDVEAHVGQEVTVEAAVHRILSPIAFTVTGPRGDEVEPILVISRYEVADLQPGQHVVVVAVPRDGLDIPALEEELGVDLIENAYEEWTGDPYLAADIVWITSSTG
jgi:hypothetical protein